MADQPVTNPPPSVDPTKVWSDRIHSTVLLLRKFIIQTSQEWLYSLLNQPMTPPFKFNPDFKGELGRAVRLIVSVLIISTVLVGGLNLFTGNVDITKTFNYAITIFIISVFFALIYTPLFFISGVRIYPLKKENTVQPKSKSLSLSQVFYTILFTFVSWIPLFVFMRIGVTSVENVDLQDFLLIIAPILCLIYIQVNFARTLKLMTNCPWYRILIALLLPTLLIILPIFYF